ncbi:MAG: hypothetical protein ACOCXG_03045 [Nanoarchaeota archaeon]
MEYNTNKFNKSVNTDREDTGFSRPKSVLATVGAMSLPLVMALGLGGCGARNSPRGIETHLNQDSERIEEVEVEKYADGYRVTISNSPYAPGCLGVIFGDHNHSGSSLRFM